MPLVLLLNCTVVITFNKLMLQSTPAIYDEVSRRFCGQGQGRIIGSTQKKKRDSLHAAEEMDKRKEDLQAVISALSQTNYSRCLRCTHRGRPAGTSVPPV